MKKHTVYKNASAAYNSALPGGYTNPNTYVSNSYQAPKTTWGNWNYKSWGKSTFNFDSFEKKMKRKKDIIKAVAKFKKDRGIVAKVLIGGDLDYKRIGSMYSLVIPNTNKYKNSIHKLGKHLDILNIFPRSFKVAKKMGIVKKFIESKLEGSRTLYYHNFFGREVPPQVAIPIIDEMMEIMDKPQLTEEDFDELMSLIPPKKLKELEEENDKGHGGIFGGKDSIDIHRKEGKLNISPEPTKTIKEASLLKGRRINRKYIQNMDYKSLIHKRVKETHKQKLLILLDGSGSMSGIDYDNSVNFSADLINLDKFEIVMYHTESDSLENVTKDIHNYARGSTTEFMRTGGSEGFPDLNTRSIGFNRDEDYVLVLTDMEVPPVAESALTEFIGNKKHLVLSFGNDRKFDKLNVRHVETPKDMKNVITTLLG